MGEYDNLLTSLADNGIFTVTLNRPSKLNALNSATIAELRSLAEQIMDDARIKGVIVTGAGEKAFAAGADIAEIAGLSEVSARKFSEMGQEAFTMLEECTKPIIAAVNGYALGGGCELAMACHMRVATAGARFGLPETTLGLVPGYGGTQRLTQLIGKGKALEMMMTADMIMADEALRLGLANHVVPTHEELLPKCQEILEKVLAKAPIAIMHVIDCVNSYFSDDDGYQNEANSFANCCRSEDFKEGAAAFLEKRKPLFKGK